MNSKISFTVIYFYIAIFLSLMPVFRPFSINFNYSDIIFMLLFLLIIVVNWQRININFFDSKKLTILYFTSFIFFIVGFGISNILNGGTYRFFEIIFQYFFLLIIIPFVFVNVNYKINIAIKFYIYSIMFIIVFGIYIHLFTNSLEYSIGGRMGSLLKNPNSLAKLIAISFPILLFYMNTFKRKTTYFGLLLFLVALLLSSSFGGIFASLLSIFLFYIFSKKYTNLLKNILLLSIISFVYLSIFGLPEIFYKRILPIFESKDFSEAGSFSLKIDLMKEALSIISNNPLIGIGAGNYVELNQFNLSVHNTYLLIWSEGGILSIIGMIGIMTVFLLQLINIKKNRILRATGLSILSIILFNFITDVHFYNSVSFIGLYIILFQNKTHLKRENGKEYSNLRE